IAILAAMLFPVLRAAQEKAERIICINNLKQLLLANTMYSNDNNEYVALPNDSADDGADRPGWLYRSDATPSGLGNGVPAGISWFLLGPEGGVFWNYIHGNGAITGTTVNKIGPDHKVPLAWKIYQCPLDPPPGYANLFASRVVKFTTYCMNWGTDDDGRNLQLKTTDFKGSDWWLWERDNTTNDPSANIFKDGTGTAIKGIGKAHGGKGADMGYLDGHVGFILYDHFYSVAASTTRNQLYIATDTASGR
ncbi:MAG: hypothetical protein ACRED1_04420, partial [Limisphaerales bacterium]